MNVLDKVIRDTVREWMDDHESEILSAIADCARPPLATLDVKHLSVRARNQLGLYNIKYPRDLETLTVKQLQTWRNCGPRTIREIVSFALEEHKIVIP